MALFAPVVEQADAVHAGQAEVEYGGVVGFGAAEEGGFVAVVRGFGNHPCFLQDVREALRQFAVVFDDEDSHQRTSISSSLSGRPLKGSSEISVRVPSSCCRSIS